MPRRWPGRNSAADGDDRGIARFDRRREITRRALHEGAKCKLCEVKCPYTPRDGHEFQLDFPRLIMRARTVQAREEGIKLREKMLGNPDRAGKTGALLQQLANWSCRGKFQRVMMEK